MIIDSRLEFSDKQVVTSANAPSTNTIDVGANKRDIGPGQPMFVVVQLGANAANGVTVTIETSDASNFNPISAIGSVVLASGSPAGTRAVVGFPYANKRYIRLKYSAAGTFNAWLSSEAPTSWQAYPAVV